MIDRHGKLVRVALAAIKDLFGDMSVGQSVTLDSLEMIVEEIGLLIEALEADISREEP